MNLRKMFSLLNENKIKYIENEHILQHWICENNNKVKSLVRDILKCLDHEELNYSYFNLKKKKGVCDNPNCVNPDCYSIIPNPKLSEESMNIEDLKELAEIINLEDYCRLGEKEYLNLFNEDQPDFLKITKKQLKLVINYIRSTKK